MTRARPTPTPASASVAVADLLEGQPRPARVLAAFLAAVYLDAGEVVALVTDDGIAHPNAVVVAAPSTARPFAGVRTHAPAQVGGGGVSVAGLDVRVARWFDPVPRLAPVTSASLGSRVDAAAGHLAARDADLPADLAQPLADLVVALRADAADPARHARRLLGRGPGLTPAGDDVLAGLLAAVAVVGAALPGDPERRRLVARTDALGQQVADAARDATTAVSAALLGHARRGAVAAPAARVLHALAGRGDLPAALDGLLAVGSTSGRDLAAGLVAGAALAGDPTSIVATPTRT